MVNKTSPFVKRSELPEGEFGMVREEVLLYAAGSFTLVSW
jgi:hypothetical protein